MPPVLPRPQAARLEGDSGPSMWVDEAIWGHRLYDEQTPWLTFLEFLNVLDAEARSARGLREVDGLNSLAYRPNRRLYLRNIVFNNPRLVGIRAECPDDESRWASWLEIMDKERLKQPRLERDFTYLREHFERFDHLVSVVDLLRASSIEGASLKQFTSKFVFPFGPDCLFEDLDVRNFNPGRRFFARTGELTYLMLCRSGRAEALLSNLSRVVLDVQKPLNRLVRALQPAETESVQPHRGAYLPYESLPDYAQLADDWLALLRCSMPGYDVVPHLVNILGLNLLLYFLRRAQEQVDGLAKVTAVCEIIAPRRTVVRDLATDSYEANNLKSLEALDAKLRRVSESREWRATLGMPDPVGQALRLLKGEFDWEPDESCGTPAALFDDFRKAVFTRHDSHIRKIHAAWSRALGLASRRGTRRVRYAPNDDLLKTLVLTVVDGRMEFQQFLARLHERYGLVMGHHQAADLIDTGKADQKAFEENAKRLEMRLGSMGLLRRLSDACAYVVNPFSGGM